MIVVANRIPVNPDFAEEFEATFANRASLVDSMEGFVAFKLLRPQKEGDPYIVQTYWESHEHFKAWTESDAFKAQHGQQRRLPEEAVLSRPQIEIHEIIQSNERATEAAD